jgi:hypothetical protein
MILGFTPTPTTLLLNEAPSSRKQQGKKEKPKKERKTHVTARCTEWIMLIRGEKVQDEVLHRAAEEHNSANLKYKQMKSLQRNKFCVASPLLQEKFLHESSGLLRLLLEMTTSHSKKKNSRNRKKLTHLQSDVTFSHDDNDDDDDARSHAQPNPSHSKT